MLLAQNPKLSTTGVFWKAEAVFLIAMPVFPIAAAIKTITAPVF
jgi:hypothetical protein